MLLSILVALALNTFACHVAASQCTSVVDTTLGPVQGEYLNTVGNNITYASFKGIRFGKAPVGRLRFKPPYPAEKWTNVLNATFVGAECPQLGQTGKFTGNEDCLFLNVFTPVSDFKKELEKPKAVIVFIYGRLYSKGSADPSLYGPDFFLENDVVVVTFNYRVGSLGFLALNHKDCTGNAGLKDQRLALQWVQQNIASFGGDRGRVTLLGESVGAVSALYHSLSAGSLGLFHRVIAMSGSPLNPWGYQSSSSAEENAYKLGSLVGKNCTSKAELLQTLYKSSAEKLVGNEAKLGFVDPPFRPVVEDPEISPVYSAILTRSALERYKSGQISRVPHLLGVMSNESLVYVAANSTRAEVINQAKRFAAETHKEFTIPSVYAASLIGKSSSRLIQETTDLLYNAGMEQTKRLLARYSGQSVYYYTISIAPSDASLHRNFFHIPQRGASHGDDIPYIFWVKGLGIPLDKRHPVSIVRARIVRMWTNFAKFGNPTPDGVKDSLLSITWPDYRVSGRHLDISEKLTIKSDSSNANIDAILSICPCRGRNNA